MDTEIHIRNMVCPRCIKAVKDIMATLGIECTEVSLGQATIKGSLATEKIRALGSALKDEGFELLDDVQAAKSERIRLALIEWARMEGDRHLAKGIQRDARQEKGVHRLHISLIHNFASAAGSAGVSLL